MAKLDRLVWAASSTYRVGPYHIGVRSDSDWLDALIRTALHAHHVPGVEAPPNFSVVIPRNERGAARGLNMLYEGHSNLVRSRHPRRVLLALFQHLSKHLPAEPDGHVMVSDIALVRDGRSVLVPRGIVTWMDQLAPRLNRAGWQFVDQPWSALDIESAELVVSPTALDVDETWEAEMDLPTSAREPDVVPHGRYPLAGWGVFSTGTERMSTAAGAAAIAPKFLNPPKGDAEMTLLRMVRLADTIPVTGLGSPYDGDFAARLGSIHTE